ncbi:MAG: hypothetical protein CVU61_12420 [Deltaproteobacteria bacterium HGW-Deltaproteobacteria-19]|nr:MAG: hypothetical protein CVU61_12420 [Deltaproteobacteria bacterium HGW-Deltaproteobacteria-19]
MSSSLWIGATGMTAVDKQLDVIGNNLANSSTVGYKASNAQFSSMLSQTLSGGSGNMQVGQGVSVSSIATNFAQGSFQTTSSVTDLAIDGEGLFIAKDGAGLTYYTRNGSFAIDEDGYMVDGSGYRIQGNMFVGGAEVYNLGDINLANIQSQPMTTTTVHLGANLNAQAATGDIFSASQTVYGNDGAEYTMTTTFTKTANAREWSISGSLEDANGNITNAAAIATLVTFDANGAMLTPAANVAFTFAGANIGTAGVINWDVTSADAATLTGFASDSTITTVNANGYSAGSLQSISIGTDGVITGSFSNGQTEQLARFMMADFANYGGLSKVGTYFTETDKSGAPLINQPGSGSLGGIMSNSLEVSNTDVAAEFINMITAQRAYQSCAKVVSTANDLQQLLMNIKQ